MAWCALRASIGGMTAKHCWLALAVLIATSPAAARSILDGGVLSKHGILVVDGTVLDGAVYLAPLPARWDAAPKWFVSRDGRFTPVSGKVSTKKEYKTADCTTVAGPRLTAKTRLAAADGLVVLGTGGDKAVIWTAAKALGKTPMPACVKPPRPGLTLDTSWETEAYRVRGLKGTFHSGWFEDARSEGECVEGGKHDGRGAKVGVIAFKSRSTWCPAIFRAETDATSSPCKTTGAPRGVRGLLTATAGGATERWLIADASTGPDGTPVSIGLLLSGKSPYRARRTNELEVDIGCPAGP